MRVALSVAVLALVGAGGLSGCASNGVSKAEVTALKQRVDRLERENGVLRGHIAALGAANRGAEMRFNRETRALHENDKALETGAYAALLYIFCSPTPQPGCHVPLSVPGAVYEDAAKPGRIFATPIK